MAYEITGVNVAASEQPIDEELVIRDIAMRWVEYCILPAAARDQFAEWGDSVIQDASGLSDVGILRVYDMMSELVTDVHADAQDRFAARRQELARQAEDEAARAAEMRLASVTWRAAARLQRTKA